MRTAALLLTLAAALAAQTRQSGDVAAYLTAIPLPGARSEAFRIPTAAQIAAGRDGVAVPGRRLSRHDGNTGLAAIRPYGNPHRRAGPGLDPRGNTQIHL